MSNQIIAEDSIDVNEAPRQAENAQQTADKAVSGITNLNDPNLMSVIEKQNNISRFAGLTSQYNVILARAKDANISTTDLTTAYTNLNTFMATILMDTTKASDVDRDTYKGLTDTYNTALSNVQTALSNNFNADIDNMSSSVSVASQAASSATIVASQAATTGNNASQVASQAIGVANEAKSAGDNAVGVANNASQAASSAILAGSTATVSANKASSDYQTLSAGVKDGSVVHITTETVIDKGVIGTAEIANGAITNAQIGNEAVGTAQIGGLAVGTAQIGDGAITNAKIGSLAVGTAQIANAAITDAKVGNISANKLTAGTIDFNTITGKNINASNITVGKLDTDRLNVGKLSALSANLGDVTTGSLKGVDIVANSFSTPNGSFTTDANGAITATNMTINGGTINTPNLNLGDDGQLTGSYSVNDSTAFFQPISGTGSFNIDHGYIQSTANIIYFNKILNEIGDKWGHWESSTQFVPSPDQAHPDAENVAESTLTPAFLKLDIYNADKSSVNSRAYIDGTGLYINNGQTQSITSMLSDYELLSSGMAYLNSGIQMKQDASFTFGNLTLDGYHTISMLDGKPLWFRNKSGANAYSIELVAKTFTKSSRLSLKHDITPLSTAESSRLLNAIDVEKFRYTHDDATYKYQYGGVIDDVNSLGSKQYSMPPELLSEDGTGINLDSLTGILIKRVQDQDKMIGKLSMRLTKLEMEK